MEYIENGEYVRFKCKNYDPHKFDPHCSTDPTQCPIHNHLISRAMVGKYDCYRGIAKVPWTTYLLYCGMDKKIIWIML